MKKPDPCTNCQVDLEYMPPFRPCLGCKLKSQEMLGRSDLGSLGLSDNLGRSHSRLLALRTAQNGAGSVLARTDRADGLAATLEL